MNSSDQYKPSFFEAYAAAHLSNALRPAFRFVLETLSVRHPRLIRLAVRSDDIFTALLLVLETSQLRKESALLAESFYSLRRSSSLPSKQATTSESVLSGKQVIATILTAVIAPYIKTKLDNWYSNSTGGAAAELFADGWVPGLSRRHEDEESLSEQSQSSTVYYPPRRSQLPRLLISVLADMKRLLRTLKRLLTRPSIERYFSLSLAVQGLVLRRASPMELLRSASQSTSFFPPGENRIDLLRILSAASERLLTVFKASFFAGIFVFRFLQYYYAAEAAAPREAGPTLPTPEPLQPAAGVDWVSSLAPGKCPLCRENRVNPTACVTSGYVFCYLCILRHIQATERCPVTLAPTVIYDLVRVYDEAGTI